MTTKAQAEALKTLTEARRLLRRGRGWTKGRYVTNYVWDKNGYMSGLIKPEEPNFQAYCSIGAIEKADGPGEKTAVTLLGRAIRSLTGKRLRHRSQIIEFNDAEKTAKRDVLAAFDAAIEMAKGTS